MLPPSPLPPDQRQLVITRLFDAPREVVWRAWTDPEHARRWWGPRDYPATQMEMDVRPGGSWRHCLSSTTSGPNLWHHGIYREVVPPKRLVFTFQWEEEGERGLLTLCTVQLDDQGGKTLLTFRQTPFHSAGERDGHSYGWNSTFDRMVEHLQRAA